MENQGTINHLNRERTRLHDENQELSIKLHNKTVQLHKCEDKLNDVATSVKTWKGVSIVLLVTLILTLILC
jgi:hypothetical protein